MELVKIWLIIIGAGTVIYWIVKLGIWAYEYDLRHDRNRPSTFNPWRYNRWRKEEIKRLDAEWRARNP